MKNLIDVLKGLRQKNAMYEFVVDDLLETPEEDLEQHMKEILNYGCVNGTVSSMIYYSDTITFFDNYKNFIVDLMEELEVQPHQLNGYDKTDPFCEETTNKNLLAWLAYEEVTRQALEAAGIY